MASYQIRDRLEFSLLSLLFLNGGPGHQMKAGDTYVALANVFGLSEQDRTRTRDSDFGDGRGEPVWHNRVQWARNGLLKAGYLDDRSPRGVWRLSPAGIVAAQGVIQEALAGSSPRQGSPEVGGSGPGAGAPSMPDVEDLNISVREGGKKLITHLRRERNSSIVAQKRKQVLSALKALRCEVCRFDFQETYGDRGKEFCEVHHVRPLGDEEQEVETSLSDLAVLCSNCHRMIHRDPAVTVEELRDAVREIRKARLGLAARADDAVGSRSGT